jgi:hypothetical protein
MNMVYEDTCEVVCTQNDNMVVGEVLYYRAGEKLTVSLNRAIKVEMRYNQRQKIYSGNSAGLEFTSDAGQDRQATPSIKIWLH